MHDGAVGAGRVRIGIIGATTRRGWAGMAHVPAIRALPSLGLHAVATRSKESARAAAGAFDAPLWFDDPKAMMAHDEVDAVAVAVKAPDHFDLVRHALLCGKPVYCEWPFGRTVEEARILDALARERNVATAVGLQGRFSPWLRQARDMVAAGSLGRILSTSLLAYDELSVGSVDEGNAYLLDAANGANPLHPQRALPRRPLLRSRRTRDRLGRGGRQQAPGHRSPDGRDGDGILARSDRRVWPAPRRRSRELPDACGQRRPLLLLGDPG